jgi:hypothetical protein
MMDRLISLLRENDGGEPYDNSYLGRMGWMLIVMVGLLVAWTLAPEFTAESDLAAVQEAVKFAFASVAVLIFLVSLRWPSRKIEGWLDEHYPEHQTDYDYGDYSLRSDFHSSLWVGGIWGFRFAVGYAVSSILLAMTQVLTAMAESGYPLTTDEVTRLTVLNSFAIAMLTTLLAGVASIWLIDWSMRDTVERLNTPERSTFGTPNEPDHALATDGGENDGA